MRKLTVNEKEGLKNKIRKIITFICNFLAFKLYIKNNDKNEVRSNMTLFFQL